MKSFDNEYLIGHDSHQENVPWYRRGGEMSQRFLKRFLCAIGFHSMFVGYDYAEEYHGFNAAMKCKWCGLRRLVDSQGNLF